ncbi:hypothetical protein ASPSYDRAFT_584146 [Aspergillus sydowii CBS 593.65]|uniref:Uncharacterized protein n=1 Tax=Aspergillus sydowii CBS 593.65 TaxID=1036612 RepID=A0A1L9SZS6_9EURO|nr:uncharacterized protein ASPSYDRAFT_584146 [Aspergillus sydowii CBS 593.65]OJJ52724.1 hypothetical protein ASPSYDRAFT_584146 [Aspergillus sydowii CBS 593.65]
MYLTLKNFIFAWPPYESAVAAAPFDRAVLQPEEPANAPAAPNPSIHRTQQTIVSSHAHSATAPSKPNTTGNATSARSISAWRNGPAARATG